MTTPVRSERKRRRSAASSLLAKRIAMDSAVVPVCFVGEEEVHSIEWSELLTPDGQQPFSDISDLTEGVPVLAPWVTSDSKISYADAVIVKDCPSDTKPSRKSNKAKEKRSPKKKISTTKARRDVSKNIDRDLLDALYPVQPTPTHDSVTQPDEVHVTQPITSDEVTPSDEVHVTQPNPSDEVHVTQPIPSDEVHVTQPITSDEVTQPTPGHPLQPMLTSSFLSPTSSNSSFLSPTGHSNFLSSPESGCLMPSTPQQSNSFLPPHQHESSDYFRFSDSDAYYPGAGGTDYRYYRSRSLPSNQFSQQYPARARRDEFFPARRDEFCPARRDELVDDTLSSISEMSCASSSPSMPSSDLAYVYSAWISPLKGQMKEMMGALERMEGALRPGPRNDATDERQPQRKPQSGATSESNSEGVYLGHTSKDKYRVLVPYITYGDLDRVERGTSDYVTLSKKLLQLLFSKELEEEPNGICCTPSEGRRLLDPTIINGIRFHLHRKILSKSGIKLFSEEEEKKWKLALQKMNAHIRYKRTVNKKNVPEA